MDVKMNYIAMNTKKIYTSPNMEVYEIQVSDLVATSINIDTQSEGNGDDALSNTYRNSLWN